MGTLSRLTTIWISGLTLAGCMMGAPEDGDLEATAARTEALMKCEPGDCAGDPGDDIPPGTPTYPPPQLRPPAPYATPLSFAYPDFAFNADVTIEQGLRAPPPAGSAPWPLATIPFVPETVGPVHVESIDTNLWAFSSFDAGGNAVQCLGTCSTAPAVVFNPNYGTYQATLRLNPRLDIEFWEVRVEWSPIYGLMIYPNRVAEITATIHMRAYAECVGWEIGNGHLNEQAGASDVTIARDTGVLEDIADFFLPGFSESINQKIRAKLLATTHVGHYQPLSMNGGPCATLGVSGDANLGAFTWNPTPPRARPFPFGLGVATKTDLP